MSKHPTLGTGSRTLCALLVMLLLNSLTFANCVLPPPNQLVRATLYNVPAQTGSWGVVLLENVPPGYTVTDNTFYLSWCVNAVASIIPGPPGYDASMYDTSDPGDLAALGVLGVPVGSNEWNKINYILNNKGTANATTLQAAIWRITNPPAAPQEPSMIAGTYLPGEGFPAADLNQINALEAAANANSTFVPGPGQVTAVYLYVPGTQPLVIEVVCPVLASIGDTVFCDYNENGVQDSGEPGIQGVKVSISCVTANGIFTSMQVTDQNGKYLFEDLLPGTCTVTVDPATAPPDCNRIIPNCPLSRTVTLAAGQRFLDADFCFAPKRGRIGDTVFCDLNKNGVQDPGDVGIPGVKVNITCHPLSGGTFTDFRITDADGKYLFTNLQQPATCTVTVDKTTLPPTCNADVPGCPSSITVNLAPPALAYLDADFCFTKESIPGIALVKTVDKTTINAGEPVTYTYTVTNTGGVTLTNVVITDDNATPGFTGDDFTVATIPSLAPGVSQSFSLSKYPPITMCSPINSVNTVVGTLTIEILGNGDVKAVYRQSLNLVDNTYGTNASPGWPNGHTWSNFTGSDRAQFVFSNAAKQVVLDVIIDYVTASSSFPSGFGSLGASGGEGRLLSGSLLDLVSATTTISTNINQSPAFHIYATSGNSPASPIPAAWDLVNGYTVVVKGSAFTAGGGFGSVAVPSVHNSPPKIGSNEALPKPCDSIAVNIATATATAGSLTVTASGTATVNIVGGGSTGGGQAFTTYKRDNKGWDGNSAATALLNSNFATLYPAGLTVGGTFTLKLTTAAAVQNYLPSGGGSAKLTQNYVDTTVDAGGELGANVVALKLNVDFSNASILKPGLAALKLKSGKFAGQTVAQVLTLANSVLGGGALPSGISIGDVNTACKTINENFDKGTTDKGNLIP